MPIIFPPLLPHRPLCRPTGAGVADHHVHAAKALRLRGFGHELCEVGTLGMRKTWGNIGIPKENQGFTGFTQENVDFKPEKNVGLARFHHSDGSFNHQHKEFEAEKNSDMSWGYKENLCFWVDHTQIHLDICVCLFKRLLPLHDLLNHHFSHQDCQKLGGKSPVFRHTLSIIQFYKW